VQRAHKRTFARRLMSGRRRPVPFVFRIREECLPGVARSPVGEDEPTTRNFCAVDGDLTVALDLFPAQHCPLLPAHTLVGVEVFAASLLSAPLFDFEESIQVLHRLPQCPLDGSSDEHPIEETCETPSRLIFDDEPVSATLSRGFEVAFMANIR